MTQKDGNTKTVVLPEDLYNSLQELKQVFSQMTGQEITDDADVIGILLSAFIDSVQGMQEAEQGTEIQQDGGFVNKE